MNTKIIIFLIAAGAIGLFSCNQNKSKEPVDETTDLINIDEIEDYSDFKNMSMVCKDVKNSYECAQKVEISKKKEDKSYFERKGNVLIIKPNKKSRLEFVDVDSEDDNIELHTYWGYIPEIQMIVIHKQYYEGHIFIGIDKYSNIYELWGPPALSPDGSRILSYSEDIEAGYSNNGIQIWRVNNDSISLEFKVEPSWGPNKAKWVNNDEIQVLKRMGPEDNEGTKSTLEFQDNVWSFKNADEAENLES